MPKALIFISLIAGLLAGCASPHLPFYRLPSVADLPFIHKIDVQQGNVITQEMVGQLRKGMEKKKVQYVMGTPIILDTFNNSRWDYIYTFQHRGSEVERRRITLVFADDKLERVDGNVTPAAGEIEVVLHQDTTIDVPRGGRRGVIARLKSTIPFTGDKDDKAVEDDKSKQAESGDKTAAAADDKNGDAKKSSVSADLAKSGAADKLAAIDKSTGIDVPEDPSAEKATPAPIENPYENIQAAPGEGVVVPPDAPLYKQHKRGLATRFYSAFGLGEDDYVRPSLDDSKPPERLIKRPPTDDE